MHNEEYLRYCFSAMYHRRITFGHLSEIETLVQILVEEFTHARRQPWFVSVGNVPYTLLDRGPGYGRQTY